MDCIVITATVPIIIAVNQGPDNGSGIHIYGDTLFSVAVFIYQLNYHPNKNYKNY